MVSDVIEFSTNQKTVKFFLNFWIFWILLYLNSFTTNFLDALGGIIYTKFNITWQIDEILK